MYDKLVFNKMRAVLGGRVRFMMTASAPISSETLDFLKIAFCCPILEAYGQTECTGASHLTSVRDGLTGHVGGTTQTLEMKV
jgi:long-chain acyl-CoA synthetase